MIRINFSVKVEILTYFQYLNHFLEVNEYKKENVYINTGIVRILFLKLAPLEIIFVVIDFKINQKSYNL